jgi:hypothetical protein
MIKVILLKLTALCVCFEFARQFWGRKTFESFPTKSWYGTREGNVTQSPGRSRIDMRSMRFWVALHATHDTPPTRASHK